MKRNVALNLALQAADLDQAWMELDAFAEDIYRIIKFGVETDGDVDLVKRVLSFVVMNLAQRRAERDQMEMEL